MRSLSEKFNILYNTISSSSFLNKDSIGGEIPFYIADYESEQELQCREEIELLIRRLENNGIKVLELNLYNLSCEILEAKGGMERMFRIESNMNKDRFLSAIQSSLNIHEVLMPHIKSKIEEANANVYFLTGIGLVFPFIRSHNVLNNLQNIAKNVPTIAFYPGHFSGTSLSLFNKLIDDNYYRAFNIFNIKAKYD